MHARLLNPSRSLPSHQPLPLPLTPRACCMQRAAVSGCAAGVWLGLRLQLLAATLVTAVASLAVLTSTGVLPGARQGINR